MPAFHVPKPVLVDLLAHASSVARICHGDRLNDMEPLSDHVQALVQGLTDLLRKEQPPDVEHDAGVVDELRQLIARADALASTTDEQLSHLVTAAEGGDRRGFNRLAHLVELTAAAVTAAAEASGRLIALVEGVPAADRA